MNRPEEDQPQGSERRRMAFIGAGLATLVTVLVGLMLSWIAGVQVSGDEVEESISTATTCESVPFRHVGGGEVTGAIGIGDADDDHLRHASTCGEELDRAAGM